jgi:acylphosphatase
MKTIRLTVKGKVQGVYFRANAKNKASELGITGWVKNLPDDTVEIKATATDDLLQQFINWCREGPSRAIVNDLIIEELPYEPFIDFRIIK